MVQVIFSEAFLADLSEQIDKIRQYRTEKSARLVYDSVFEVSDKLKNNPNIGKPSTTKGVRSIASALDFRIYYVCQNLSSDSSRILKSEENEKCTVV
jgi:plasmid stabilization system protein ParE